MPEDYLYDLPVEFYRNGCVTDGKFDPEKALALGYNEHQLKEIEQFIGSVPPEASPTQPLLQMEESGSGNQEEQS